MTRRRASLAGRRAATGLAGVLAAMLATALTVEPARAQSSGGDWNAARAIELMQRARQRRTEPIADSLLRNYQARADGRVYFYLDRRESERRTLVKTDQIALEVFWAAPDLTKQRIIGLRDESRLPNRMRYHLDHLTVVQNEFGNAIRLGDGDEVSDVPHPAAPGSDSIYDFRLADSLSIRLPGAADPVRAYEIQVRPKRTDRPAIVGSVFIDRASADIVRMTFTFTPVSYVDRRLDYINISLDNSLWDGRYWLPHEQSVEIRRQIPELDFVAGAVILGRFRVSGYQFNLDMPARTFMGYRVEALPATVRRSFDFPSGLYDELQDVGLAPPPEMHELRAEAARLLGLPTLSGLPRFRLALGGASEIFRFDRAEGAYLGAGVSWEPAALLRGEVSAGFASGPEHGSFGVGLRARKPGGPELFAGGYFNELRDLGVRPGEAGVISSIAALGWGDDYRDPYFASGVRARLRWSREAWTLELGARSERHRSATLVRRTAPLSAGSPFRAVLPIEVGWLHAGEVSLLRPLPQGDEPGWGGQLKLEGGAFEGGGFLRPSASGTWQKTTDDLRTHVTLRAATGVAIALSGDFPSAQHHFLLGGRNTLPGYAYRSFAGDGFALIDADVARDVAWPWLRVRATAALGLTAELDGDAPAAGMPDRRVSPRLDWGTTTTDGLRPSLGVGAGLLWDVIRIEAARGLRNGEWQVLFTVNPRLWDIL